MNTKIAKWGILGFIFFGLFFFILGLIMALPTYLLWNWLMPMFGLPTLTIWQSLGLLFLSLHLSWLGPYKWIIRKVSLCRQ